MRLAKFFSYRLESYKELTCSWRSYWFHLWRGTHWDIKEDELQRVWATIAERYSSSRSKAAHQEPCARYVHKALANTFFARKATGTINEGEVKLLDMGIKPIISRTKDGKKIRGDRIHAGNLMPLLTSYSPTRQRLQHSVSNGKEA
ncbi:unnamed protein product [Microthlaspi erraticum]|uniref:Arabidopsis retrotransposon Orf1 C-terminal domain-containing protein n=1 Tax=Microthlaspi erraticum TaxID=1685480 RepID=A0A6D2IEB8_9BRAS|nr:unnamed protein product [Microthlaspi erraticum]